MRCYFDGDKSSDQTKMYSKSIIIPNCFYSEWEVTSFSEMRFKISRKHCCKNYMNDVDNVGHAVTLVYHINTQSQI